MLMYKISIVKFLIRDLMYSFIIINYAINVMRKKLRKRNKNQT